MTDTNVFQLSQPGTFEPRPKGTKGGASGNPRGSPGDPTSGGRHTAAALNSLTNTFGRKSRSVALSATPKAFHALFGRIGARAKMQFPIHPHMLRHGCGYALANAGHDTRAL
jgi:hypothetical protein